MAPLWFIVWYSKLYLDKAPCVILRTLAYILIRRNKHIHRLHLQYDVKTRHWKKLECYNRSVKALFPCITKHKWHKFPLDSLHYSNVGHYRCLPNTWLFQSNMLTDQRMVTFQKLYQRLSKLVVSSHISRNVQLYEPFKSLDC